MPLEVVCNGCGEILFKGLELRPPDEIIQIHDGKCPKCGRKLSFTPIRVEVKSVEEMNP
jgi:hypothetical protein